MAYTISISAEAAQRLRNVLNTYNIGILAESIIEYYRLLYPGCEKDLHWDNKGHKDLDTYLGTAPDDTFKRILNKSNCWLYYSYDSTSEPIRIQKLKKMKEAANDDLTGDKAKTYQDYKELILQDMWDENNRISVKIGEVYSPQFFWLIPTIDNCLDKLMAEMKKFYLENKETWRVDHYDLGINLPCVVLLSDKMFHRAMITAIVQDQYEVFIIDYGNVIVVNKYVIWYLHRNFFDYPAQAFMGGLSGIKPRSQNYKWDVNAADRFMQITDKCSLEAEYVAISQDGVKVNLHDVSTVSDRLKRTINQVLVNEEYADFILPEQTTQNKVGKDEVRRKNKKVEPIVCSTSTGAASTIKVLESKSKIVKSISNVEESKSKMVKSISNVEESKSIVVKSIQNVEESISKAKEIKLHEKETGATANHLLRTDKGTQTDSICTPKPFSSIHECRIDSSAAVQTCLEGFIEKRNDMLRRVAEDNDVDNVLLNFVYTLQHKIKELQTIKSKFDSTFSDERACGFTSGT